MLRNNGLTGVRRGSYLILICFGWVFQSWSRPLLQEPHHVGHQMECGYGRVQHAAQVTR